MLIYHYTNSKDASLPEIKDCIKRFETLDLSPRFTFLEASYFWVAKAHLMIELAFQDQVPISMAAKAVRELGQTQAHPSLKAHGLVAQAKLSVLMNSLKKSEEFMNKARALAIESDNLWVQFEILNCHHKCLQKAGETAAASEALRQSQLFCETHGWKGLLQ